MPKPVAYATAGGLARLARAKNPEEFITVGAGEGGAFSEPLYAAPPLDKESTQLLAWLTELVQCHPKILRTLWVGGTPVGDLLVERLHSEPAAGDRQ